MAGISLQAVKHRARAGRGFHQENTMKRMALIAALLLASSLAFAHSGGTDSSGCHTNHKTGEYHCH